MLADGVVLVVLQGMSSAMVADSDGSTCLSTSDLDHHLGQLQSTKKPSSQKTEIVSGVYIDDS